LLSLKKLKLKRKQNGYNAEKVGYSVDSALYRPLANKS